MIKKILSINFCFVLLCFWHYLTHPHVYKQIEWILINRVVFNSQSKYSDGTCKSALEMHKNMYKILNVLVHVSIWIFFRVFQPFSFIMYSFLCSLYVTFVSIISYLLFDLLISIHESIKYFKYSKKMLIGTERSLQIIWKSSRAEHSFRLVTIAYVSHTINTAMAISSSRIAACHALCSRIAHQPSEGLAKSRSSRNEIALHSPLDIAVCGRGMCRQRGWQEGYEHLRVSFFHTNYFSEKLKIYSFIWIHQSK